MERGVPESGTESEASAPEPQYRSWDQIAGYFDGDGNVRLEILMHVLRLGVRFADTWLPQLESIRSFLISQGLAIGNVGRDEQRVGNRRTAFRLDVGETFTVIKIMRKMIGLCVKKKVDLQIGLDYLEDRITGDEAVRRFNDQCVIGRRRGKIRTPNLPHTRSQELRLYELENARKAWEAHTVHVDDAVQVAIRRDHFERGLGVTKLGKKYGYSLGVIERILRGGKDQNQKEVT